MDYHCAKFKCNFKDADFDKVLTHMMRDHYGYKDFGTMKRGI